MLSQYLTETLHGKLEATKERFALIFKHYSYLYVFHPQFLILRTTRRILPLVDRTEIDPTHPSGVPLRDILSDSRRKVADIRAHMEFQYRGLEISASFCQK